MLYLGINILDSPSELVDAVFMKYTLFAFQLFPTDLEQQSRQQVNPLAEVLTQTQTYRADIHDGIYVFDTQKGWRDMHRL
jgi:hypothetical protein